MRALEFFAVPPLAALPPPILLSVTAGAVLQPSELSARLSSSFKIPRRKYVLPLAALPSLISSRPSSSETYVQQHDSPRRLFDSPFRRT